MVVGFYVVVDILLFVGFEVAVVVVAVVGS